MATIDFIIQKAGGGTINLYNKNSATLSTITNAEQSQGLSSDDIVRITVESAVKITFDIGDKMNILGRWYKINRLPTIKKTGNRLFTYNIELEGVQYDLARVVYDLTIDTTSNALQDVQADMLTGNLQRFATVLIANANRVFPGKWVLGDFPAGTEDKTLVFGETDNCLLVLQRLCSEYNTEFEIIQAGDVNTLHFRKAGQIYPYTFEYGKGKGLYSLERLNVSTSNIVTRLKVYGGTRNITAKYRAARLCLPGKTKGQSYIQKTGPANNYGIWEATKIFEHIYPKRTGTVTAIDSGNVLKLTDSTMNFDLNEKEADGITTKYLIDGSPAKIHFNTGNLSGYEFEIQSYDHATKTFTLKPFEDERGERFPSEKSSAFKFAVNDKYVLLDIALPQSYIDDAEEQLAEEGGIYYDQNSQPKVQYSLEVAEEFLKELSGAGSITNIFSVGDYIPVKDTDIDVDKSVRVQSFTRDLLNPFSYKLNISDTVTTNITNRVISELIEIDKITKINDIKSQVKARRDWRSAQELLDMVFDTEGDYYSEKIKPNSIETSMLAVGAKSTQFGLVGTVIQANYNGNKNSVNVKGGTLSHYAIEESGRNWTLADGTTTLTGDSTPYYIYAKCQKVGTAGSIIFSTSKITVDEDPSFYHFLIGVVNSVDPTLNVRSVALTYGFTTVNGKFIRTGRIQSNDGLTYFDLDLGEIGGKITFRSTGGTDEDLAEILDGVGSDIQDTQAAVENLQIGGRNLALNTSAEWKPLSWEGWYWTGNFINYTEAKPNEIYTISIHLRNVEDSLDGAVRLWVWWLNEEGVQDGTSHNGSLVYDEGISKATFTIPEGKYGFEASIRGTERDSTKSCEYRMFKAEKGNKATDWTPAPEDVQAEINDAKQEALTAAGNAQATANSLKDFTDTAFRDGIIDRSESVAIEKYKNSLNEAMSKAEASYNKVYLNTYLPEGTAKTSLLNAKINLWGQRDTLLSAINTAISGGITTPAQKTAVDNAFSTFNNLMTAFQNALEEASKSIQAKLDALSTEKVDNLQIGGRNLIREVDIMSLGSNASKGIDDFGQYIRFTTTNSGSPRFTHIKYQDNTQYTLSVEASVETGSHLYWYFVYTDGSNSGMYSTILINSATPTIRRATSAINKTIDYISYTWASGGYRRIYNIKLEKGNKATDWTPAPEDVDKKISEVDTKAVEALAKANISKAITDKFGTTVNGGLISTVVMLLRELNSTTETAFTSGIQGTLKNLPAFGAGTGSDGSNEIGAYEAAAAVVSFMKKVANGQTPAANEYDKLAKIALMHNGAAKIGHFFIEALGRIFIADPSTGKERLVFLNQNLPTVANLESQTQFGGSISVSPISVSPSYPNGGSSGMTVSQDGSKIVFNGATINISGTLSGTAGGFASAALVLVRNGVNYMQYGSANIYLTGAETKSDSVVVPAITLSGLPSGSYAVKLALTYSGTFSSLSGSSSSSTLSWSFSKDVDWFQFGLNGMMGWWQNTHLYVSDSEVSGKAPADKWDVPGLVFGANVAIGGGFTSWWGAKKHVSLTATKNSTGRYTVYHSIGHSDYQITATPTTANRSCHIVSQGDNNFVIEWRSIGSSPALSDTGFHFHITGNNYKY